MRGIVTRYAAPLAALTIAACSSSPPAAPPPAASASDAPAASASAPPVEDKPLTELPTTCDSKKNDVCLPPPSLVKKLCGGSYPDVALAMFAKGTPWTRGYLRVKSAEAWNASGGASSGGEKLVFDEELLILTVRIADTGGMVVSGAGGNYDVLRWDGACVSLSTEEVTLKPSPTPKHTKIPWKSLDDATKNALMKSDKVAKVAAERKKECKGVTMGDVSLKCVKADEQLSVVVVDYVRSGGAQLSPRLP